MKAIVYSTQTCPYCVKVKEYLQEKGIEYKDIDVSADQEAANTMIQKSGQMGVPVTVIMSDDAGNETVIVGFDTEKIDAALAG